MLRIYHNSRCRKSRETLELIRNNGHEVEVIEYLKNTPSPDELRDILHKLQLKSMDLIRKSENTYKEKFAGKDFSEEEWLAILVENPILIERPIVVSGEKAIIGRPPENVLSIL